MEGIPCLVLWREIISVFGGGHPQATQKTPTMSTIEDTLTNVDYVPTTLPENDNTAVLLVMEDNESVIKMVIKTRAASMRHVSRTHRIDLDWLFERFHHDPAIQIRYIGTKEQIADFLTKGAFAINQWKELCKLAQIGNNVYRSGGAPPRKYTR